MIRGGHPGRGREDRNRAVVARPPNAFRTPRREADFVADVVDLFANTVDPTKAKRFIYRFRPGDASAPGIFAVVPDPERIGTLMVLREPGPKELWGGKEFRRRLFVY